MNPYTPPSSRSDRPTTVNEILQCAFILVAIAGLVTYWTGLAELLLTLDESLTKRLVVDRTPVVIMLAFGGIVLSRLLHRFVPQSRVHETDNDRVGLTIVLGLLVVSFSICAWTLT